MKSKKKVKTQEIEKQETATATATDHLPSKLVKIHRPRMDLNMALRVHAHTRDGRQHARLFVHPHLIFTQPKRVLRNPDDPLRTREGRVRKAVIHRPVGVLREPEVIEEDV